MMVQSQAGASSGQHMYKVGTLAIHLARTNYFEPLFVLD